MPDMPQIIPQEVYDDLAPDGQRAYLALEKAHFEQAQHIQTLTDAVNAAVEKIDELLERPAPSGASAKMLTFNDVFWTMLASQPDEAAAEAFVDHMIAQARDYAPAA